MLCTVPYGASDEIFEINNINQLYETIERQSYDTYNKLHLYLNYQQEVLKSLMQTTSMLRHKRAYVNINLNNGRCTDTCIEYLTQLFQLKDVTIYSLDISNSSLTQTSQLSLLSSKFAQLLHLDMSFMQISPYFFEQILKFDLYFSSLCFNGIETDAIYLSNVFRKTFQLQYLQLSASRISNLTDLPKSLPSTLLSLNMSFISDIKPNIDIIGSFECIKLQQIQEINLSGIPIGHDISRLLNFLRQAENISLNNCDLQDLSFDLISDLKRVKQLSVIGNNISKNGFQNFKMQNTLTKLICNYNNIDDTDAFELENYKSCIKAINSVERKSSNYLRQKMLQTKSLDMLNIQQEQQMKLQQMNETTTQFNKQNKEIGLMRSLDENNIEREMLNFSQERKTVQLNISQLEKSKQTLKTIEDIIQHSQYYFPKMIQKEIDIGLFEKWGMEETIVDDDLFEMNIVLSNQEITNTNYQINEIQQHEIDNIIEIDQINKVKEERLSQAILSPPKFKKPKSRKSVIQQQTDHHQLQTDVRELSPDVEKEIMLSQQQEKENSILINN
ncbi:Leucine-rich_repeat domain superfamily [Hexamita inflata]|uniref:Leucine-rich repeat domain superfamily n=1 Tax=Hexamita inflata TaxID=28002 RepID=A0AA86NSJ7_9EUKA|nr:Leucine-rich repeat domain superfamily [Hexamita inflata]